PRQVQDDSVRLDRDRVRLRPWPISRLVGGDKSGPIFGRGCPSAICALHRHFVRAYFAGERVEYGFAAGNVKLPTMPGAADNIRLLPKDVLARLGGKSRTNDVSQTERRSLVRTPIQQRKVLSIDVKDADGAPTYV